MDTNKDGQTTIFTILRRPGNHIITYNFEEQESSEPDNTQTFFIYVRWKVLVVEPELASVESERTLIGWERWSHAREIPPPR